MSETSEARKDRLTAIGLFALTAIVFWPATKWIVQQTLIQEQLISALSVLIFAAFIFWKDHEGQLKPAWYLGAPTIALLAASYILLGIQYYVHSGMLVLGAYFSAVAAFVVCWLGPRAVRDTAMIMVAFIAYVFFVLIISRMDWPLRGLAGGYSGWILGLLGHDVKMLLVPGEEAKLLLAVGGRPFHVAAECNGFGLISASLLLALLVAIYRRAGALDALLYIFVGLFAGFTGNVIRIIIIILLAPRVSNYMIMHEIVGVSAFYATLGALYWLAPAGKRNLAPAKAP